MTLLLQITRYFKANKNRSNNFLFIHINEQELMMRRGWDGSLERWDSRLETCCTRIDMQFCSIHSEPTTAKTRLLYMSDCSLQFRLATPRHCEREERTNRNWFYVYALASLCLCSRHSKNNNNSKPSLCLSTLPTSLSLHRQSNAKYAINKREPCEFLSKYTPLSLSPSRTAYALSTCIHAFMPT